MLSCVFRAVQSCVGSLASSGTFNVFSESLFDQCAYVFSPYSVCAWKPIFSIHSWMTISVFCNYLCKHQVLIWYILTVVCFILNLVARLPFPQIQSVLNAGSISSSLPNASTIYPIRTYKTITEMALDGPFRKKRPPNKHMDGRPFMKVFLCLFNHIAQAMSWYICCLSLSVS